MQGLTKADFYKQMNRIGITGAVKASLALEAFRMFIQSELPEASAECEPLYVRHNTLIIQSTNPALMNALRDREVDITQFIEQSTGVKVERIQFRA